MSRDTVFTSLHGSRLGIGFAGHLVALQKQITPPCADASITVSAEGATTPNTRDITIQLKDVKGNDIDYQEIVDVFVLAAANLNAIVGTGGSTGIGIGTDGAILTTVAAKKHFIVASEADGDIDLEWLDTGTEVAFLGLRLPTGRIIFSDALTNT